MAYIAPIHRPSSVKHAIQLNLFGPNEQSLVLAKANRLEVYESVQDGLKLVHSQVVYGKISMLEKLNLGGEKADQLFVGTDRFMYFIAKWDPASKRLVTQTTFVDQADKSSRDSETQDRCLIDPSNRFMALLLFEGIVTIIPLAKKGKGKALGFVESLGDPISTRIPDFAIRSCAFLHTKAKDKFDTQLAILSEDTQQRICLTIRALQHAASPSGEPDEAELENVLFTRSDLNLGATHLIPVPAPSYGLLVLAATEILYYSDASQEPLTHTIQEPAYFVAWTAVDQFRWILGDDFGRLFLLMLQNDEEGKSTSMRLDALGSTSRASTLVHLGDGIVFVGSHQGDSQLVSIVDRTLNVLQTIPNIAPILDFTIMDMERRSSHFQTNDYSSGQARIVTGSGVFGDGSLRSVRSGVGMEEHGILAEMDLVTNLFALRSSSSMAFDDVLLVSFVDETRVFTFDGEGMVEEQESFKGLTQTQSTLLASITLHNRILQVTPASVYLVDLDSGNRIAEWTHERSLPITAASVASDILVLAIEASQLVTIFLRDGLNVIAQHDFGPAAQISCLHISSYPKHDLDVSVSGNCYVGFWQQRSLTVLNSMDLKVLDELVVSDDSQIVPRSIELAPLISLDCYTLLIALANGEVITFLMQDGQIMPDSRKAIMLGTQQVSLRVLPRGDGLCTVFATGETPSLIYGSRGRLVFSGVTAENSTFVCPFHTAIYQNAIAIATNQDIRIASLDMEPTTHVDTLHIGELARRTAYSPTLRTFAVGTVRRYLLDQQEMVQSRVKLTDEVAFQELDSYDLNEEELVESVICAELDYGSSGLQERYVVGTSYAADDQDESVRGRILVFAVTDERKLRPLNEHSARGACRALGSLHGKLVAALVKSVVLYAVGPNGLDKLCSYRTSTAPIDLSIDVPTSQIAVADLMKSLTVVTYNPPSKTQPDHQLIETGRHFETVWSTAVCHVESQPHHAWLQSDAEGNLTVLYQDLLNVTQQDKHRLRVSSEMRLGEMVNRIRPVKMQASPHAIVLPKAFIATVDGGVYLFGLINSRYVDLLIRLQSAMASRVESLGHVPFARYRALKTQVRESEEPYRFVDGELIEAFIELDERLQAEIVDELGDLALPQVGVCAVRHMVDALRRLH